MPGEDYPHCGVENNGGKTMRISALVVLLFLLAPFAVSAQQSAPSAGASPSVESNPVSNATRKILERQSKNIVAAADAMPADKFSYKPTPSQMSFAALVEHTAGTNNFLCASISGTSSPPEEKLSETDPKEKLVSALKASFDYCTMALAKVDDSKLGESIPFFGGRQVSRAMGMIILASAFADHYGMAAMYLRLNGLVPPTAKPKE
jgi:hypothetical protein